MCAVQCVQKVVHVSVQTEMELTPLFMGGCYLLRGAINCRGTRVSLMDTFVHTEILSRTFAQRRLRPARRQDSGGGRRGAGGDSYYYLLGVCFVCAGFRSKGGPL